MMIDISLDEVRADDLPGLTAIYLDSARHHVELDPDFYHVPDAAEIADLFRERLDSADQTFFVARAGRTIVGSVDIQIVRASKRPSMVRPCVAADIGIAVLAGYRGMGIGQRLLAAAEEWALAQGAERLTLNCHAANVDAIRLYNRLGYRTTGLLMENRRPSTG